MTATPDLASQLASASLYPFQVNWTSNQIYLLPVNADFYENAAFLDQRAIVPGMQGAWHDLATIREIASEANNEQMGLIFHIGHCGSTLISRTLGLLNGFTCLREPLPLRDLAHFWADRETPWAQMNQRDILDNVSFFRSLWARTATPKQISLLKATSFCSLLAKPWLAQNASDRAVFLSMAPETYIATVLGAPAYVADLIGGAKPRIQSLIETTQAKIPALHALSAGEVAALTYAAEMVNMQAAALSAENRCLRLDFDRYLNKQEESLSAVAAHFGYHASANELTSALNNPLLKRYSKATEYAFSSGDRLERLKNSRLDNHNEITRGMNWIIEFAKANTVLADALKAFGYAN